MNYSDILSFNRFFNEDFGKELNEAFGAELDANKNPFLCYGIKPYVKGNSRISAFGALHNVLATGKILATTPQPNISGDSYFISTSTDLMGMLDENGTYPIGLILDAKAILANSDVDGIIEVNWHSQAAAVLNKSGTSTMGAGGLVPIGIEYIGEYMNIDDNSDRIYVMKLVRTVDANMYILDKGLFDTMHDIFRKFNKEHLWTGDGTESHLSNGEFLNYYDIDFNKDDAQLVAILDDREKELAHKQAPVYLPASVKRRAPVSSLTTKYVLVKECGYDSPYGGPRLSRGNLSRYLSRVGKDLDINDFITDITSSKRITEHEARILVNAQTLDIKNAVRLVLLPKTYSELKNADKALEPLFERLRKLNLAERVYWYDESSTDSDIRHAIVSSDNITLDTLPEDSPEYRKLAELIQERQKKYDDSTNKDGAGIIIDPNKKSDMDKLAKVLDDSKSFNIVWFELMSRTLLDKGKLSFVCKQSVSYAFSAEEGLSKAEKIFWPNRYKRNVSYLKLKLSHGFSANMEIDGRSFNLGKKNGQDVQDVFAFDEDGFSITHWTQGGAEDAAPAPLPIPKNTKVSFSVGADWKSDISHFYEFNNLDEIAGGSKTKDVRDKMYGDFKPSKVKVIVTCNLTEDKLDTLYQKFKNEEAGSKK